MANRRHGRPGVIENVVWVGKKDFEVYVVEFESNGYITRFVVPKPCGNFWFEETPAPVKTVETAPPEPPPPPPLPPPPTPAEPPAPEPPAPMAETESHIPFFIAGFGGKQRLVHEEAFGGRCDTLFGVKGGNCPD